MMALQNALGRSLQAKFVIMMQGLTDRAIIICFLLFIKGNTIVFVKANAGINSGVLLVNFRK